MLQSAVLYLGSPACTLYWFRVCRAPWISMDTERFLIQNKYSCSNRSTAPLRGGERGREGERISILRVFSVSRLTLQKDDPGINNETVWKSGTGK